MVNYMTPEIQAGIFGGESGGDYDALYGFSNRPGKAFGDRKITEMTLAELDAFDSQEYGPWSEKQLGYRATPTGAYQVVGDTRRSAARALGLSPDTVYNKATQDQIGEWILQNQGTGAWEGYKGPGDPSQITNSYKGPGGNMNGIGNSMFAGDPTMSARNMPTGMAGPLPNGPVPQYDPRQGMIRQLMGGNFRKSMGGMFSAEEGANPRLEAERFARKAASMDDIGDHVSKSMRETNAPVSWAQVLAGVGSEVGEQVFGGATEGAKGEVDTQLTDALSQELTPERMAQIKALDPEFGGNLMMDQRGFEQDQLMQDQQFQNAQELLRQKAGYDQELAGVKGIDPTTLMQNAQAAGYTPGTPEYQQFIKDQLNKIEPMLGITGWTPEGLPIMGPTTGANGVPTAGSPGSPSITAPAPGSPPVDPNAPVGPINPNQPDPTATDPNAVPNKLPGTAGAVINVDPKDGTITAVRPDGTPIQTQIPGGKTEREIADTQKKQAAVEKGKNEANRIVIDSIDDALERSNAPGAFGTGRIVSETLGGILPGGGDGALSGSPAASLDAILEPIKANIGFERLQEMRENSPTGGALGPVSDRENSLLQSTYNTLSTAQTKEQFQEQLLILKRRIIAVTTGEDYEEVMGFPPKSDGAASTETPKYETGKIYVDGNGNKAKWNGTGWEDVQ